MVAKEIFHSGYREVIARLRDARRQAGLSQTDVAQMLGCCRTRIAKIEECELKLGLLGFVRMCRVYGLDPAKVIRTIEEDK